MKLDLFPFIITIMKTLILLRSSFSPSCLWFLLVLSLFRSGFCVQNSDHVRCIPTERLALLDLKNNLTDPANRLSSWVGRDCCTWFGVVCDRLTGHVHEIRLRGSFDDFDKLEGTVSSSVIKLLQLRYLDLSCNSFGSSSIPAFLGSFQNLIHLNLSFSSFSGEIPYQLGNLSTLHVLDLHHSHYSSNNLHSKSLIWLINLKGLQHLDMSGINLRLALGWFWIINNLTSLLELHFSWCSLNGLPSNPTTVSFTSLVVLDLSHNRFDKSTFPGWIFSLHKLTLLDLTGCRISGVKPGTYGGFHSMPSLTTLHLSRNTFMNDSSLLNEISSLSSLRLLDVSWCHISSPVLGNLKYLSSIVHLDLLGNQIVEEIPESLSNLCNVTTLDLSGNYFYGNVSELLQRFCECESPKLEYLDLQYNNLTGQLPERLGKLKNLVEIHLYRNQLTGIIPDSIGGLSSLTLLDVSHNMLNGIVTQNHFTNLTDLKSLSLDNNKLVFKLNVDNWIPPFKLVVLTVGSCSLGPQFPLWIQSQKDLGWLDVSNTNISDIIPNWILSTFSSLHYLNISHNNIRAKLGDITSFFPGETLDLSNNHLHGMLPSNFNRATMDFLDISNNNLSGSIQQFLCSGIEKPLFLRFLNLANNNFSGVIPDCWTNWQSLVDLNLNKNQFSGTISSSLGNISSLKSLDIDDNKLSGNLPLWLLNSNSLVLIKLADNELTGKIPSSIEGYNSSLRLLSLRSNNFEGKIPNEICRLNSIQIMDLSHNDLSGNIPRCFTNFSIISGVKASRRIVLFGESDPTTSLVTKGNSHTYSTILYLVTLLDFSNNKFSGPIPDELVGLLGLRFLNLSRNDLTGPIPDSFSKTGQLESLDLSMNRLSGRIPLSMSQLTALDYLNVSYNNFVGRIPTGPQFQTFNESSFNGNKLCGDPLPACLKVNDEPKGTIDEHDGLDWILVISSISGLVVGFWIIVIPLFISKQCKNAYYHVLDKLWFKLQNYIFLLFLCFTKRWRSG